MKSSQNFLITLKRMNLLNFMQCVYVRRCCGVPVSLGLNFLYFHMFSEKNSSRHPKEWEFIPDEGKIVADSIKLLTFPATRYIFFEILKTGTVGITVKAKPYAATSYIQ